MTDPQTLIAEKGQSRPRPAAYLGRPAPSPRKTRRPFCSCPTRPTFYDPNVPFAVAGFELPPDPSWLELR